MTARKMAFAAIAAMACFACAAKTDIMVFLDTEDYTDALPELKTFRLKGTWVHTPQLEDRYLSDRLRWQLWTLRRDDWRRGQGQE